MSLWSIADTHLSFGVDKPMDIFGARWEDHSTRMAEAWQERVQDGDTVLIPGDVSWAMTLDEALPDLRYLHELPGQVLIGRGNHDYWWTTKRKLEQFKEAHGLHSLTFMRNDAHLVELSEGRRAVICNSRGWILPGDPEFKTQDQKIYDREVGRIKLSLDAGRKLLNENDLLVCALHYPPLNRHIHPTPISALMEEYNVQLCVYGHVHGVGAHSAFAGVYEDIEYINVASDFLNFEPLLLAR